ncbi:MAG: GNAT family N-acetyltransferase [Catalinimonas sp.]
MIFVKRITDAIDLQTAMLIRRRVFVEEQKVPHREEYDQHEGTSNHYLAVDAVHTPCGTARWRVTDYGIKLERFAVDANFRHRGVGTALVEAILKDLKHHPLGPGKKIYLHAQLPAVALYRKFGFESVGEQFTEAGIEHCKMERPPVDAEVTEKMKV